MGNNLKRKIVRIRKNILMKEPKKKSDEEAFYDAETLPVRELKILNKKKMKIRKKQEKLIAENKKLITDISVLSSSDRIETIAENDLGMRKAETEEIVRVEMRKNERK